MSRIGKKPIILPNGVEVEIKDDQIEIKGPKGTLTQPLHPKVSVDLEETKDETGPKRQLRVKLKDKSKKSLALWGLFRSLIFNMVQGVTEGVEKKLEIEGVGYRASVEGNKLVLNIGFSHPIEIEAPPGINFQVDKNVITVSGIDKQLVGQVAAKIRDQRKPEPYKGKGIRYLGEEIRRKPGKKAVGTE